MERCVWLPGFNEDNFAYKYFTCKSPLIIDPIDTVRVEGPEMLKKIQIHYTLLKTSIFVQNFNLRKITIFSARWILSKRFVSFVKIEFLDKNYNQGIVCCKSTYTKVWKSRRIWQTPVVHLQTRALQAPSAKSEAAKYVEFWEIWNFGSKNTLIC